MKKQMITACLSLMVAATSWTAAPMSALAGSTATESASTSSTANATETSSLTEPATGATTAAQAGTVVEFVDPAVQASKDAQKAAAEQSGQTVDEAAALSSPAGAESSEMDKATIQATFDENYQFEATTLTMYLTADTDVVDAPNAEANSLDKLSKYASVVVTGTNTRAYWEIRYHGSTAYIDASTLTSDQTLIEEMKAEDARKVETEGQHKAEQAANISEKTESVQSEWSEALAEERSSDLANQTRNPNWNGPVLSRSKGSVYGPSGKETYYNLNMSGCVRNMNRRGYYGEVWVRNDGCKMFGNYIMCAANLSVHPFGSLVESSLGTCIVVDTGGFASSNSQQLDIAVTW